MAGLSIDSSDFNSIVSPIAVIKGGIDSLLLVQTFDGTIFVTNDNDFKAQRAENLKGSLSNYLVGTHQLMA